MINIEKNKNEIIRRLTKYIIHTILILVLLTYGPCTKLNTNEIILLTLSISCLFCLLDIYSPNISNKD